MLCWKPVMPTWPLIEETSGPQKMPNSNPYVCWYLLLSFQIKACFKSQNSTTFYMHPIEHVCKPFILCSAHVQDNDRCPLPLKFISLEDSEKILVRVLSLLSLVIVSEIFWMNCYEYYINSSLLYETGKQLPLSPSFVHLPCSSSNYFSALSGSFPEC